MNGESNLTQARSPMIGFMAITLLAAVTLPAHAQSYPSKPIRIVVPFTPGGGSDIVTRVIGPKLMDAWGQQVVVDNRAGAGGTIGAAIVAGATPDGHTLLITSSAFAGAASLYPKLPYDTIKDFAPIALVASTALILVVAPSLGPRTVNELVALARQKPGQINFASAGVGSGTHYAGELFKLAGRIDVVHVPYLILLVDLDTQKGKPSADEALRVVGNLVTPDGKLASGDLVKTVGIGTRVRMVFSDVSPGLSLPQWTIDESATQPDKPWRYPQE